jgi:hypothetical protein
MSETVELMSQEAFEAHLAAKYGEGCYALKVAQVEAGRVKATLRLSTPEATPAPAPAPVPQADLHALGTRWQAGEGIANLAREVGYPSWNMLHGVLKALGYTKGA